MYVIAVELEIKLDKLDDFRKQLAVNARASRNEPGCRQFDVCTDPEKPGRIFLYEVYDDQAAFNAHHTSEHFKTFDRTAGTWIASKNVRIYNRVDPR